MFAKRLYPHFDLGSKFFETFKENYTFTDSFFWSSIAFEDFNTEQDLTSEGRLGSSVVQDSVSAQTPSENLLLSGQVNLLIPHSAESITSRGNSSIKVPLGKIAGMPSTSGECFLAAPYDARYSNTPKKLQLLQHGTLAFTVPEKK